MVDANVIGQIVPLVQQVLGGALTAGGSGMIGKLKEMGALSGFLTEAAEMFQGSTLVQDLIAGLTSGTNPLEGLDLNNLDLSTVLSGAGSLKGLLDGLGDEGQQLKQFVVSMAERVVGASGSGLFGGGTKVNEQEQSFLDSLRQTLGL